MSAPPHLERVEVRAAAALRDWLAANHAHEASVLLVTWKAARRDRYVSTGEVLDELIAFGWIDGRRWKLDAERTMQLIAPRRQQVWAQSYKDRAARLTAEGRMAPPGLAAIAESKAAGLWDAATDVDALVVPHDLAAALDVAPPAGAAFDSMAPSYRRNVLRWIAAARTAPTRAKRIAEATRAAAAGEKVPQM
jgi:uncharacterized protein YdeI (YjbR/CyaY-like superfamily)